MTDGLVCYVTASCPFCTRLKWLFGSLGVEPQYIDVDKFGSDQERQEYADAVGAPSTLLFRWCCFKASYWVVVTMCARLQTPVSLLGDWTSQRFTAATKRTD